MDDNRLSVRVSNELSEIPRLAEAVDAFCAKHGIPQKFVLNFQFALDEALTNVISYAFTDERRHEIDVEIAYGDGLLDVEIIDDGRAFDPLQAPLADVTSALEDRAVGGLGVHLIKALMDTVDYRREQDRNHLRFRKRISRPNPVL